MVSPTKRSQVRTPLIISFSILLAAVSAMGIFLFVKYDELGATLSAVQYEESNIYYLQREQKGLFQAENSVQDFVLTHDLATLKSYYVYTKLYEKRRDFLLARINRDSLKPKVHRFIEAADRKYANLSQIIAVASQGRDLKSFFNRISLGVGADSLGPRDSTYEPQTLRRLVDSADDVIFPMELPEIQVDSLTDSITLSREALLSLQGYQQGQEADLRPLVKEGTKLSEDINQAVEDLVNAFRNLSGKEVKDIRQSFLVNQQFFIVFSIATVLMGLLFLAYIVNTLDRNRRLQEELEEEKARAEHLAQAKEEFLANMSHEIRTPMNAVIGFSEQLAQTALTPLQQRLLAPLRNSAQYLLALINDILDISKLDSGNFRLDQQGFRTQDLVEDVKTGFDHQAKHKGLDLRCEVDSALPEILIGDSLRLKQMLYNLVSNALKFTESGEVTLCFEQEERSADGKTAYLHLWVRDTGIGIPPEKRDDIFSKFIQAESHTARRYGGTGLGLAITKRLTELMEGRISLESEVGHGTTVHLYLPLLIGTKAELMPGDEGAQLDPTPLRGKRVLLVDDEIYNRELAQFILDKWHLDVVTADDGRAALKHLEDHQRFDLVLMDLHMPNMSGIEATQHIRQRLGLSLPILAMTATATPARLREARKIGMDGHLLKPFREAELLSTLLRLLDLPEVTRLPSKEPPRDRASEAEPTRPSSYSLKAMYRLAHDDERFVKRMLTLFVERSEDALQTLREAASRQDWTQVGMSAHKLVPPCRHLGLQELVHRLKQIERDAEAGQAISRERMQAVVRDLTAVRQEIQSDIEKLSRAE